ncbi:LysR family transcriptional regulator [Pokkaliibacter sp. MBI-7]|uniref:LysR family transcriptional regulator n=1 Tax=Pokkaliibacter sp. MBI-7 TaxID=3040600 RepID=UPI00244C3AA6|nr:LysR family transcriptional regulator [Pokkaliibacter sp. MBI-7]MDH2433763.1 LysR family transcriptional regulator [Pokkaliibacter sp. MBI-7]
MQRPHLPLKALLAFEAAARHLSFTLAAQEMNVTQAAVSHQVKALEERLGVTLFRRLSRGLALTPEGEALLPSLRRSFDTMAHSLRQVSESQGKQPLTIGVVGTFATGWLLPRLVDFYQQFPWIDLRLSTHNNRVNLAEEGLDLAVRFGDGAWHGTLAEPLMASPLTPLCTPQMAAQLTDVEGLLRCQLLRSYREEEWSEWFTAAGLPGALPLRSPIQFDSSLTMMEAARQGHGVALAPVAMFRSWVEAGWVCQPFAAQVAMGRYWLTRLRNRDETAAMRTFSEWLQQAMDKELI